MNKEIKSCLTPVNNLIGKINQIFDSLVLQGGIPPEISHPPPEKKDSSRKLRERKLLNK